MQKTLEFFDDNFNRLSSSEVDYLRTIIDLLIKKSQLSLTEKKLIMKMAVREKCEYYGYPIVDVDFCMINDPQGGNYNYETNKITISSSIFSNKAFGDVTSYPFFANQSRELDRLLLIANHECEHYFQYFDYKKGILSRKSFSWLVNLLTNRYTSKNSQGQSEYQVNYGYREIENYANIQGWYDTGLFLTRHKSKLDRQFLSKLCLQSTARQSLASQKGRDGKRLIIEDYNIKQLMYIVYMHPSLVGNCPLLSYFFLGKEAGNKRGKLKDLDTLLYQYQLLEQQYGKTKGRYQVEEEKFVYRQFFYYLIGKDASMVPSQYDDVLYDLAFYDLISLEYLFDIEKKPEIPYQKVSKIKVNRIITFLNRLEENKAYDLLDKLMSTAKEVLKAYETSKLMYNDYNDSVEKCMQIIRDHFWLDDIEFRNPVGRISALNI